MNRAKSYCAGMVLLSLFFILCPFILAQNEGQPRLNPGQGWMAVQSQNQGELGHFVYAQNGIAAAELSMTSEPLPMTLTPLQYAQAVEQNVLSSMPQYQKLQERTVPLAGVEAAYFQFNYQQQTQMGLQLMTADQYFIVMGNTGYMIILTTLSNSYQTLKPVFDQAIQTLQFGNAQPMPVPPMQNQTQNQPMPYPQNPPAPMTYPNPYGQQANPGMNQAPNQDMNAMLQQYQQYQQQQQQMMQQYLQQMYGQQNQNTMNNPYAMPSMDMSALVQKQAQLATMTPPPFTAPANNQALMNPNTIPTYPTANQGGQIQSTPLPQNNPFAQDPAQIQPAAGNVYGQMPAGEPQAQQPAPVPGPVLNSYQDPQGRFAILIPQDYQPINSPAGTSFQGNKGQMIQVALVQSADEVLLNMVKDKQILDDRDAQVQAGIKIVAGKLKIFLSVHPQTGQRFVITALAVPERNLIFTFTTAEDQFQADSDLIIQVLRSVDVHEKL